MALVALDQHKGRSFWISWQILWFIAVITNSRAFPYILNPPPLPPKPGPPVRHLITSCSGRYVASADKFREYRGCLKAGVCFRCVANGSWEPGFVFKQARACALRSVTTSSAGGRVEFTLTIRTYCFVYVFVCFSVCLCQDRCLSRILHLWLFEPNNFARLWTAAEIEGMTSFDSNYQNAFRCNLCNVDLCHSSQK